MSEPYFLILFLNQTRNDLFISHKLKRVFHKDFQTQKHSIEMISNFLFEYAKFFFEK